MKSFKKKNDWLQGVVFYGQYGEPINCGKRWKDEDINKLKSLYQSNTDIDLISQILGRDIAGVLGRLLAVGEISNDEYEEAKDVYYTFYVTNEAANKPKSKRNVKKTIQDSIQSLRKSRYPLHEDPNYRHLLEFDGYKIFSDFAQDDIEYLRTLGLKVDIESFGIFNSNGNPIISGIKSFKRHKSERIYIINKPIIYGFEGLKDISLNVTSLNKEIIVVSKEVADIGSNKQKEMRKIIDNPLFILVNPLILSKKDNQKWVIEHGENTNWDLDIGEDFWLRINRFFYYTETSAFEDYHGFPIDEVVPDSQKTSYLLLDQDNNLFGVGNLKNVFYGLSTKRYKYTNTPISISTDNIDPTEIFDFVKVGSYNLIFASNRRLYGFGKDTFYSFSGSSTLYGTDTEQHLLSDVAQYTVIQNHISYVIDYENNLRKVDSESYDYHHGRPCDNPRMVQKNMLRGYSGLYSNLFIDGDRRLYEKFVLRKMVSGELRIIEGKSAPDFIMTNVVEAHIVNETNYVLDKNGNVYEYPFGQSLARKQILSDVETMVGTENMLILIKSNGSLWMFL